MRWGEEDVGRHLPASQPQLLSLQASAAPTLALTKRFSDTNGIAASGGLHVPEPVTQAGITLLVTYRQGTVYAPSPSRAHLPEPWTFTQVHQADLFTNPFKRLCSDRAQSSGKGPSEHAVHNQSVPWPIQTPGPLGFDFLL